MIRLATENDLKAVEELIKSVPGFWHSEWRSNALELALRAADGLAFVWEDQGNLVGFSCAHDVGFLGYLSLLVVSEPAQGRGIGRELVQHTEQELATRGCATLISDVWQEAVGFYQALGWSGPGAVLLRKKIIN